MLHVELSRTTWKYPIYGIFSERVEVTGEADLTGRTMQTQDIQCYYASYHSQDSGEGLGTLC